jgi:HK97 family phage prohead protease
MEREWFTTPIEQKAVADDGPGEISGFASIYNNVDLQDDIMEPGAVTKSLAYWGRSAAKVPLLDWHGSTLGALIGSVKELKSTPLGLWFRAGFSNDPAAQSARKKAQEGHLSGVSIGYLPIKQSFKQLGDRTVRVLHEIRLMEISLTPVPANPEAQVASVKAVGLIGAVDATSLTYDQFEEFMGKALAIPWGPARKAALAAILAAYPAPNSAPADPADGQQPPADDGTPPEVAAPAHDDAKGVSAEEYADRIAAAHATADGSPDSLDQLEAQIAALGGNR